MADGGKNTNLGTLSIVLILAGELLVFESI
jgi:hypothetical protein